MSLKNNKIDSIKVLIGLIILLSIPYISAEDVEQTVTVDVVPGKIFIHSPVDGGVYDSRMIPINATLRNKGTLQYSRNSENKLTTLCKECGEYGFDRIVIKPFDEGVNTLLFRGIFNAGEVDRFISFTVDFKKPRIINMMPKERAVINDGKFIIKYSEENLQNITLFYGTKGNFKEVVKTDCESGEKKECVFNADLKDFDGKKIEYWFEVRDYSRVITSKKKWIKIDLTPPILTIYMPNLQEYKRKIPFNITISENVKLMYFNLASWTKWRTLCPNCNELGFFKDKIKQFKEGFYNMIIMATDEAGNLEAKEVNFTVLKSCNSANNCGKSTSELYCSDGILMNKKIIPACVKIYCESIFEEQIVEDCGDDSCNEWDNYCFDGNVYSNRSCINRGCEYDSCFKEEFLENVLVEECLYGCDAGECLIQEEIPEPSENHNVGLVEDYDGFGHTIKINDPDNNLIEDNIPVVDCVSEYDIKFLTENLGNLTEGVDIKLEIKKGEDIVYSNNKTKELNAGETTTTGNKNNFIFEEAGNYVVKVVISIDNDIDLTNNIAEREVEAVC